MSPSDESGERRHKIEEDFRREVLRRKDRRIKGRQGKERSVFFGLGMFGLVGWSVAIPTLAGLALGVWADSRWSTPYSWTLMGLILGVLLGCWNAWFWVKREMDRE